MTLKVLYLITDSGVGGAEADLLAILQRLRRSDAIPIGVIVMKGRREMALEWEQFAPVHIIGMGRFPTPLGLLRIRALIRRLAPDVVHCHTFLANQVGRLLHFFDSSFKLVSSPHLNLSTHSRLFTMVDRMLRNGDDITLAESNATHRNLLAAGYRPEKVRLAVNGVDSSRFVRNLDGRLRVRKEWGIRDDDFLIGAMGRLNDQKGFDILIGALKKVQEEGNPFRATIVGMGERDENLRNLAATRGVNVLFPGLRRDNVNVLSAFDLFVQSSRYEGLSIVLLEAMSMSLPCVATAVDGTLDFAEDGSNLILVEPENSDSLAQAIAKAVRNPDLRDRISRNARLTAEKFSLDRMVRDTESAYMAAFPL